ncbi:MAG: lipopolysaccharide core heptosyltransferase RfaQ [Enterobacteriaceae bacterium]
MLTTKQPAILIVRLRFHGDMLLTTPLLSALKQHYPEAQIDYLLYRDTAPLLSEHPLVRHIYSLTRKPKSLLLQIREFCRLWQVIRRNRYDLVLNLSEQWPVALLIKLSGAKSIGFRKERGNTWCWNHCFTKLVAGSPTHAVERNLSILQPLQIVAQKPELSLYYQDRHWDAVRSRISAQVLRKPYVVIQPTARQYFKCWDDEKFAQVIDHLMQRGFSVLLTSGPAESDIHTVEQINRLCQIPAEISLAGKTTLPELAALIDHACLFIGVDSAPMHMAAALKKPIVCLFGATNHTFWRPWSDNYVLLWAGDYQPMPERKALNRQFKYLSIIPAQDVIQAVDTLIADDISPKTGGE